MVGLPPMAVPLFRVARTFKGPSIYGTCSGGLIKTSLTDVQYGLLTQKLDAPATLAWSSAINDALAGCGADNLQTPASAQATLATMLVLLADHLKDSFSIELAPGRLLALTPSEFTAFSACDDANIARGAYQAAATIIFDLAANAPAAGAPRPSALSRSAAGHFQRWARSAALHKGACQLARAAKRLGIPYTRFAGSAQHLQLGTGMHARRFFGAIGDDTSHAAVLFADNWVASANLLQRQGLPTSNPHIARTLDEARAVANGIGWPVEVRSSTSSRALTMHISGQEELTAALKDDLKGRMPLIVQRYADGQRLRLLVLDGMFCTAADNASQTKDVSLTAVPTKIRAMAESAARILDLRSAIVDVAGLDNQAQSLEAGGMIGGITADITDALDWMLPSGQTVAETILDRLFPLPDRGRVPTAGITGSVGKTTTSQMLAAVLGAAGHTVALSTSQGAFVGRQRLRKGDLAGGSIALDLLQDRRVTASVAELARGGLLKIGQGLDQLDVACVLNVFDNHLGLDGLDTREKIAEVKSLIVRNPRRLAVLNADDPLCLAMARTLDPERLCLVGQSNSPALQRHLSADGMVATLDDTGISPMLSLQRGKRVLWQMPGADIPASWDGRFRPAMVSALFVAAMAHGLGAANTAISSGLARFTSDFAANPGRMNRIGGLPFDLWFTLADGPEVMREIAALAGRLTGYTEKVLVFDAAGDRPDAFIRASGEIVAGAFDRYICAEMDDLRGRRPREAAGLIVSGLEAAGVAPAAITVEEDGAAAIQLGLKTARAGSLLVVENCYDPEAALAIVKTFYPSAHA